MNVNSQIFRIAAPAIVSNITVPLLGLADTTISGHLGSELFIAAIAVGTMMVNVMLWCLGFLRSGTSGMTAQAFGAHDTNKQHELFGTSLMLGLSLGAGLIIVQQPMSWLLLRVISAVSDISALASQYFHIMVWSAPAILGTMAVSGWFLGMQSSFYPMVTAVATNIINIVASLVFVFVCGMGFEGTAWGSCLANWIGFGLALLLACRFNGGRLPICALRKAVRLKGNGRFFKVNTDIFFRSMCIMSVSMGMTAFGASIGAMTLAVNAVMMQFFMFFSYFMDGFAFAAEALTGKCAGSGERQLLRRTERALRFWAVAMAVAFTLIYWCCWPLICRFITPEANVLAGIADYHLWLLLMPSITVAAFIYDGMYIGLTATRLMLLATASGTAVFFLFNLCVPGSADPYTANTLLWASFLTYLLIRGAGLAALYPRALRRSFHERVC